MIRNHLILTHIYITSEINIYIPLGGILFIWSNAIIVITIDSAEIIYMLATRKQKGSLYLKEKQDGSNIQAINGIVKEFVINTIDMVKNNLHKQDDIIQHMLELLQNKMASICNKQQNTPNKQVTLNSGHKMALKNIQEAVEQLNKDSDFLSERLFDLSQNLIQHRILQIEQQKKDIEKTYENKIIKMQYQYENEKAILQSQLKQYKQKCYVLKECLEARQQCIRKQFQKQQQNRKHELGKYLEAIESIYSQLQILKNFSHQQSYNESQQIYEYSTSPRANNDNYSQQYYNVRKDERSTQVVSHQKRIKSPSNYMYADYQTQIDRKTYKSREDIESDRREADRRSSSKHKQLQPRYVQISSPRINYYLKSDTDRRQRSRSSDKQKRDRHNLNCKPRPIILHYQTPQQVKIYPMKECQSYTRRSSDKIDSDSQIKKIEQKNFRMQGVQQKLHGLKRKLERQLKTMKN